MSALTAELQEVLQLYLKLGEDLAGIMNTDDSKDPQSLVESILQNRESLVQIEHMNSRVLRLSEDWEECRKNLDQESHDRVCALMEAARGQAVRLRELCGVCAQKLQATREKLGSDLAEVGKGAQYLKSVKPIKNNYPKFIDSLY